MVTRRSAIGILIALSCVWGSSWIANSMMAEVAAPMQLGLLRYSFGFLALALACGVQMLLRRLGLAKPGPARALPAGSAPLANNNAAPRFAILQALDGPDAGRIRLYGVNLLLGCTMFALPDLLLIAAAQHGAGAFAPLVYAGLPLALILAVGELRVPAIVGIGAMFVLLNGSLSLGPAKLFWALAIVAAVALQGWSLLHARRHLPAVASMRGCMLQLMTAALVLNLALALLPQHGGAHQPLRSWPSAPVAGLATLAVLGTALAYPLYYHLLARLEPAQLATSTWLQTLVAIAESALLLHQRPPWSMSVAAAVLVVCSAMLVLPASQASEIPLELSVR